MKKIKLTQNQYALVDEEDFDFINQFRWQAIYKPNSNYFIATKADKRINGKQRHTYMHRLIMNAPTGLDIDHINHDGLDNRKCNLRLCTKKENRMNIKKKESRWGYKGIDFRDSNKNKWIAQIKFNKKSIYIGCYPDKISAAKAYDEKAKELFGEFAHLNFT